MINTILNGQRMTFRERNCFMDIYLNKRDNGNKYFSAMGQSAAYDLLRVADDGAGKNISNSQYGEV